MPKAKLFAESRCHGSPLPSGNFSGAGYTVHILCSKSETSTTFTTGDSKSSFQLSLAFLEPPSGWRHSTCHSSNLSTFVGFLQCGWHQELSSFNLSPYLCQRLRPGLPNDSRAVWSRCFCPTTPTSPAPIMSPSQHLHQSRQWTKAQK